MRTRHRLYVAGFLVLLVVAPVAYQVDRAVRSLPVMDGELPLGGLSRAVQVEFDDLGVPTVQAASREDAYRVLGYLHARDRLFQMDMQRRKGAGRLAEVLGGRLLELDRRQRRYRFADVAAAAVAGLSEAERAVLLAYAEGVNAVIGDARVLPPEFGWLRYRPEPWRPADSLLVAANMFQTLTDQEADERMLTVMRECLPGTVGSFLTPDTDEFLRETLVGGPASARPALPVPVADIARLLADAGGIGAGAALVKTESITLGSNGWVVSGSKTADGRAILANDMHLTLAVPNIWYRAYLRYAGRRLAGVTLPGLPLVIVGANGRVAWGFTNLNADVQDLVRLELKPGDPGQYRSADGWRPFETITETLRVRDAEPVVLHLRGTVWGPVLETPVLDAPAALRWTALDPAAINLRLLDMDAASSVDEAMTVLNGFGAPPQNAMIADAGGRIGWTVAGFIPRRRGFDGSQAEYWGADRGWEGYLHSGELPRRLDPPEGFIVTANQRVTGRDYSPPLGHNFAHGYRAFRIRELLSAGGTLAENDLHAIQKDTASAFYAFYRDLALTLPPLDEDSPVADAELRELGRIVRQWDGRMAPESRGIALLVAWRATLARALMHPLVERCRRIDPAFSYQWREMETPLRALLREEGAGIPGASGADWHGFLLATLVRSARELKASHGLERLEDITWGRANIVKIQHPLSRAFALAGRILDMPELPGACNENCVKVLHDRSGASERLVVSPGHMEDAVLEMPGGQSGHPLSSHFRDQQRIWESHQRQAFLPGATRHRLHLLPETPR